MSADDHIPDLHEALQKTKSGKGKNPVEPEDIPAPPKDWLAHPVSKAVGILILLGIITLAALNWSEWLEYLKARPFGVGIAIFVVVAVIGIIAFSFWRHRALGRLGERYWDTERKRKAE